MDSLSTGAPSSLMTPQLAVIIAVAIFIFWLILRARSSAKAATTTAISPNVPESAVNAVFDQIVARFIAGEFAAQFPSSVVLHPGERPIFTIPHVRLCEERVTRSGGRYSGVSIRVMKGVYYRTGAFTGASSTEVTPIDDGALTLTSSRLIFVGPKQSREIPLPKIIAIDSVTNGITVSQSGRQKTEYILGTDGLQVTAKVTAEFVNDPAFVPTSITWRLRGEEFRKIVEGLLAGGAPVKSS